MIVIDTAELATIENAYRRAQSMPAADDYADRDPWQLVLIDCHDCDGCDWAEAKPITMADLAVMCGDAP